MISDNPREFEVLVDSAPLGRSRVLFGALGRLADLADPGRTVIVTDEAVRRYVPSGFPPERVVEVPRGKAAKSLESLGTLFGRFLDLELGRDGTVLGLGGGSVSDLAGFAASTWLRGVDFGFVPTTVLAMVDASVGGKNGVDFRGRKNLLGTFSLPRFVLMDPAVLASLPAVEIASGLVEAVKHAVIEGPEHFALLEKAIPPRAAGQPYRAPEDPRALSAVIQRSVCLKARVVSADIRESGERRKLNLGHTIGHAVEAVTGLPHGVCVAAGMAFALELTRRRGGSEADAGRILGLLDRLGMPLSLEAARLAAASAGAVPEGAAFRESLTRVLSADKKRAGEKVLFALPRALGSVDVEPIDLSEIEEIHTGGAMNTEGRIFRVSIFGESHGPAVGALLDGVPPGLPLYVEDFSADLARRRSGAAGTTERREPDEPEILSGVFEGRTTGTPILVLFRNKDTRSSDYEAFASIPRPGHADFTGSVRYRGFQDPRGSGHFSGRVTAGLVAAGVVAKKLLPGVEFETRVLEAGGSPDVAAAALRASETGDSVGGLVEIRARGLPPGLGEPFFDTVEGRLARVLFAVPAVRGVEFGDGFAVARMRGSEHNDPLVARDGRTARNGAGGANGGITNGNELVVRAAVKPASSIKVLQKTLNFATGGMTDLSVPGRHDACIALRAAVVLEAACAVCLADFALLARTYDLIQPTKTGKEGS